MTKGQVEAQLSEAISKFEVEHMGRGPEKIKTTILQDMIIIRLKGFLSLSEKNLAQSTEGVDLVKRVRTALFETSIETFEKTIINIIPIKINSVFSDVSTRSGEKIITVVANEDIEQLIEQGWKT